MMELFLQKEMKARICPSVVFMRCHETVHEG